MALILIATYLLFTHYFVANVDCHDDATLKPGNFQKFGSGKISSESIESRRGFPEVHNFFTNFVFPSKPLKMVHAVSNSYPYRKWTDEYFLSLETPDDNSCVVETKKKEDRNQPAEEMHFQKFVQTYNETDKYMVQPIPPFLGKDVTLPYPLQCEAVYKGNLVEAIMWFSSGGTKSVVHTDSVENINCLYHGEKEFIMVNPHKYGDKVDIDHPEGAYSGVDVDRVDYSKYPGLAEVEYMQVNMTAGDCLYIPYKWIHQVRSYNRNIAVNVWWDHFGTNELDLDQCPYAEPNPKLTLDKIEFGGLGESSHSIGAIRDFFVDMTRNGGIKIEKFIEVMTTDMPIFNYEGGNSHLRVLKEIADRLDKNSNGELGSDEIDGASETDWQFVQESVVELEDMATVMEEKWVEVNGEPFNEFVDKQVTDERDTEADHPEKEFWDYGDDMKPVDTDYDYMFDDEHDEL